jgi:hypothetical protein
MRPARLILWSLLLPLVGSCSVEAGLGPREALRLNRAERLWLSQHLPDYDYEYQIGCFCRFVGGVYVQVRGGVVMAATRAADGEALSPDELDEVPSVLELFAIARQALEEADEVEIEYDPTLGYPTLIDIDWHDEAIDDEVVHIARAVQPVG